MYFCTVDPYYLVFSKYLLLGFIIWVIGFFLGFYLYDNNISKVDNIYQNRINILNNTTFYYFKTNFIVYNIIFFGFISFSVLSFITVLFNAIIVGYFFFAYYSQTRNINKTLLLIIPHFSEIIGLLIAFSLSIYISIAIVNYKKISFDSILMKNILSTYIIGVFMILLGAICEANITILFI